jgi:hypothetical protein
MDLEMFKKGSRSIADIKKEICPFMQDVYPLQSAIKKRNLSTKSTKPVQTALEETSQTSDSVLFRNKEKFKAHQI